MVKSPDTRVAHEKVITQDVDSTEFNPIPPNLIGCDEKLNKLGVYWWDKKLALQLAKITVPAEYLGSIETFYDYFTKNVFSACSISVSQGEGKYVLDYMGGWIEYDLKKGEFVVIIMETIYGLNALYARANPFFERKTDEDAERNAKGATYEYLLTHNMYGEPIDVNRGRYIPPDIG